jgi:hypothetical protein
MGREVTLPCVLVKAIWEPVVTFCLEQAVLLLPRHKEVQLHSKEAQAPRPI